MTDRALLIIDMLNDFLDPGGKLYCGLSSRLIIPVVRDLVNSFSAASQPIFYLCDAHAPDDKEFEVYPPHAVRSTWGAQIIPELTPAPGSRIVPKTRFSALYRTSLPSLLEEAHPAEVWLAGVVTSICVMDTAGDLRNRDYSVVIPVDAVADFDSRFHEFALERMQRVYAARLVQSSEARMTAQAQSVKVRGRHARMERLRTGTADGPL